MLGTFASTRAPGPDRLLRPAAILRRLRPLKLETIAGRLRAWDYLRRTVELAQIVAPDTLAGVCVDGRWEDWPDLLREILETVDGRDFEVDWESLDADYQYAQESVFAAWLTYIPVKLYGLSDYDESWPEEYPALALLRGLLGGELPLGVEQLANLVEEYDILDIIVSHNNLTYSQLWQRLNTADFSGYDSPLRWLPEIARIACGRTGNAILDWACYMEEEPLSWTWAEDLELARQTYAAARPDIDKLQEFLRWCDGPGEMQAMCEALAGKRAKRRRKGKTLVDILTPGVER